MSEGVVHFYVFAEDRQVYGPADVLLLKQWTAEGLVSAETWIFQEEANTWSKASRIAVLKGLLSMPTPLPAASRGAVGLRAGQLRRIRLLADMTDEQAERFVSLVEKIQVRAFASIVKQGEHGDSMFLILEGEARASMHVEGKENILMTLGVGDFFGEVALLDQGPRSADVIANKDCTLLQLSKSNFEVIVEKHPDLASRFLIAMNRFLGGRIRATNERFAKAQNLARGVTGEVVSPSSIRWNRSF